MLTSQLFAKTVCQKMAGAGLGWLGPGRVGLGRAFAIMDAKEQERSPVNEPVQVSQRGPGRIQYSWSIKWQLAKNPERRMCGRILERDWKSKVFCLEAYL